MFRCVCSTVCVHAQILVKFLSKLNKIIEAGMVVVNVYSRRVDMSQQPTFPTFSLNPPIDQAWSQVPNQKLKINICVLKWYLGNSRISSPWFFLSLTPIPILRCIFFNPSLALVKSISVTILSQAQEGLLMISYSSWTADWHLTMTRNMSDLTNTAV